MSEEQITNDEHIEEELVEEEITAEEIEKVTNAIGELMNQVESQTVYGLLQEAYDCVSALAEWEEEEHAAAA